VRAASHRAQILTSNATRERARRDGFETFGYRSASQPDTAVPLEAQAAEILRTLADIEIARDVRDVLEETSTRASLGLPPARDGVATWEAVDSGPRSLDADQLAASVPTAGRGDRRRSLWRPCVPSIPYPAAPV
jgi:hypothetical protein